MKNDRRIAMMNDRRYDTSGGRSGGAASGGATPPHGKIRRLPPRERDVYRAAIRAHLAPKERVREAALAAASGGARTAPAARPRRRLLHAALIAAALLLCTGAGFAAAEWLGREGYTPGRYLTDEQERREEPIPDVENAIAAASPAGSGTYGIRLLPELEDAAEYARWREEKGQPPFTEEAWGWLRDIVPAAGEVLCDGERLQWTTVLTTDHAAMFEGGTVVDALADRCYYTVEGSGERHELSCGGGIHKIEGNDLLLETSARTDAAFPDSGTVTVTQTIRILDCKVDMQGDCATLALLTHSFTFDAAGGAAVSDTARLTIPLSGTYCLTLDEVDADGTEWLQNELVSLDGVALDAAVEYRQTGVYVTLTLAQTPDFWTEAHTAALLSVSYKDFCSGMSAACTMGGETLEPESLGAEPGVMRFILPVFPSDYGQAQPLTMTLLSDHVTQLNGEPLGENERRSPVSPWAGTGVSRELATFTIPLP